MLRADWVQGVGIALGGLCVLGELRLFVLSLVKLENTLPEVCVGRVDPVLPIGVFRIDKTNRVAMDKTISLRRGPSFGMYGSSYEFRAASIYH